MAERPPNASGFPDGLRTNTWAFDGYAKVTYFVLQINTNAHDPQPQRKQAEKSDAARRKKCQDVTNQLRKSAVLAAPTEDRREVFAFFRSIDMVQEPQTVFDKLKAVAVPSSCPVARREADLVNLVNSTEKQACHIYNLFRIAVLLSLDFKLYDNQSVLTYDYSTYLIPSPRKLQYFKAADSIGDVFNVGRVCVQVLMDGNLLISIREIQNLALRSMERFFNRPDVLTMSQSYDVKLAPSWYSARYNGGWYGKIDDLTVSEGKLDSRSDRQAYLRICAEMVREWLTEESYLPTLFFEHTIWVEVEIPVFEDVLCDKTHSETQTWKPLAWPSSLLYLHGSHGHAIVTPDADDLLTPFDAAQKWSAEVALADEEDQKTKGLNRADQDEILMLDDAIVTETPQPFSGSPQHASTQTQGIYPTPSDHSYVHPTPGFSSVAPTPQLTHILDSSGPQSSPLAPPSMQIGPISPSSQELLSSIPISIPSQVQAPPLEGEYLGDAHPVDSAEIAVEQSQDGSDQRSELHSTTSTSTRLEARAYLVTADRNDRSTTAVPVSSTGLMVLDRQRDQEHMEDMEDDAFSVSSTANASKRFKPLYLGHRRFSEYEINQDKVCDTDKYVAINGKYQFNANDFKFQQHLKRRYSQIQIRKPLSSPSSSQSPSETNESDSASGYNTLSESIRPWNQYLDTKAKLQTGDQPKELDDPVTVADVKALLEVLSLSRSVDGLYPAVAVVDQSEHVDQLTLKIGEVQLIVELYARCCLFELDDQLKKPYLHVSRSLMAAFNNLRRGDYTSSMVLSHFKTLDSLKGAESDTNIMLCPQTRVRLKQGDEQLSANSSIVRYWRLLNLQPLHGQMDAQVVFFHPAGDYFLSGCNIFLTCMQEIWSNCGLGSHCRIGFDEKAPLGTIAYSSLSSDGEIDAACSRLMRALTIEQKASTPSSLIIYFLAESHNPRRSIQKIRTFSRIKAEIEAEHSHSVSVLLKLIPDHFLTEPASFVIRPEHDFMRLALEIYCQLARMNDTSPSPKQGVPFLLESSISAQPRLRLAADVSQRRSNPCQFYHIAYAISEDGSWLVASWSDSQGLIDFTMSYYLGPSHDVMVKTRTFQHILSTTVDLTPARSKNLCLVVAKVGRLEEEEESEWSYCQRETKDELGAFSRIAILSIDNELSFSLQDDEKASTRTGLRRSNTSKGPMQMPSLKINTPTVSSPVNATPATPISGSAFPFPATPPGSAPEEQEEGLTLHDPFDQAWITTVGLGLGQHVIENRDKSVIINRLVEPDNALTSGLLLQRGVSSDCAEAPIATLTVHLIALTNSSGMTFDQHDQTSFLKDVLTQYHTLNVLAVMNGVIHKGAPAMPLHAVYARRGVEVLRCLSTQ